MPPFTGESLVTFKKYQRKYYLFSWSNAILYWATRLIAIVGGVVLPFVLNDQDTARRLSIAIAVSAALDVVYAPARYWKIFSAACDTLRGLKLTRDPSYDPDLVAAILAIERETHELTAADLSASVEQAKKAAAAARAATPAQPR